MKKTIEVTVPTSWSAVPFKKYLSLQRDLEDNKGDELAQEHFLFYHLTGMTPDILSGLDSGTYTQIKWSWTYTRIWRRCNRKLYALI